MTTLSTARPEDLLRCGAVLGRVAEQVSLASARTERASALTWQGMAGSAYHLQLGSVGARLQAIERAYDEACDALVDYSRGLTAAHELALQADALERQADSDRLSDVLTGSLVPGLLAHADDQVRRAEQLRMEATDLESRAARRSADALDQLTADAPRVTAGGSALRVAADAAHGLTASVMGALAGFGTMGKDAALSLPFVLSTDSRHEHRQDLGDQVKATFQPWLAVERLLAEWHAHHEGAAVGELGGALLMRKTHPGSKEGARFGFIDDMHESVLRAVYTGSRAEAALDEQWLLQRAQARWDGDIERLRHLPPASLDQLLAGEVDLVHAEALGGHAIRKHVGRDEAFLRARQTAEAQNAEYLPVVSSFEHLDDAEACIAAAVGDNELLLNRFWEGNRRALTVTTHEPLGHGLVVGASTSWSGLAYPIVHFRRQANMFPYVHTTFLALRP